MTAIAANTGLGRQSLYRAFSDDPQSPSIDTLMKVCDELVFSSGSPSADQRLA